MIFNSATFLIFFIIFFILYWLVFNKTNKLQNIILLLGSYIFYGWFDFRFLIFLIVVSVINYYLGIQVEKKSKYKQKVVQIAIIQSIACLAFFKYCNFFILVDWFIVPPTILFSSSIMDSY